MQPRKARDRWTITESLAAAWRDLPSQFPWVPWGKLIPALFLAVVVRDLGGHYPEVLGIDARIYVRAAAAFRFGGDPWQAFVPNPAGSPFHFAALPPTVLTFVPLTFVSERLAVWVVLLACLLSAYWIVRMLRLPLWWLLFPPLVQGVFAANPQIILLALLLSGSSVLRALAPMLKIYALAPLVGERWIRALVLAAALAAASYLIAPDLWRTYFSRSDEIATRLLLESRGGYSAFASSFPLLVMAVIGAGLLAICDLPAAGWLVAPAVVPASQFHLSTMAMPVLARQFNLALVVLYSLPVHGLPSAIVAVYGSWRFYDFVRNRWLGRTAAEEH
jgi:hypothetical protein